MDTAFLISAFVTMFVVIDPIGLTPIFIALTPASSLFVNCRRCSSDGRLQSGPR